MSKLKNNVKQSSILKTVGLVFMVVTLVAALALTNNTVRQFVTDSFAYSSRCSKIGNPNVRQRCDAEERWDAEAQKQQQEAYQESQNQAKRDFYYEWMESLYKQGRVTGDFRNEILRKIDNIYK